VPSDNASERQGTVTEQRDVIEILVHDHREVEDLFSQLEQPVGSAAGDAALSERKDLVDRVIKELVRHAEAEEMYVYPAAREHLPGGQELADHELEEHQEAEKIMARLDGMSPDNVDFHSDLTQLMTAIRHHVQEEESDFFPKLRGVLSTEQLTELGAKVEAAKKIAPTHPHPWAPDRPPLNKIAGVAASVVDRARDAVTGRAKDQ